MTELGINSRAERAVGPIFASGGLLANLPDADLAVVAAGNEELLVVVDLSNDAAD